MDLNGMILPVTTTHVSIQEAREIWSFRLPRAPSAAARRPQPCRRPRRTPGADSGHRGPTPFHAEQMDDWNKKNLDFMGSIAKIDDSWFMTPITL